MAKKSIGNLVLGVVVGASLGILFAPKKGKETRRELKNKMVELVSNAKELSISDVSKMVEDKITEIRKDLNELDKEKVLKIAKKKSENIKKKCQELVLLAKERGLDIIALTDHNCVSGNDEAIKVGDIFNVKVIPGIELSTRLFFNYSLSFRPLRRIYAS